LYQPNNTSSHPPMLLSAASGKYLISMSIEWWYTGRCSRSSRVFINYIYDAKLVDKIHSVLSLRLAHHDHEKYITSPQRNAMPETGADSSKALPCRFLLSILE